MNLIFYIFILLEIVELMMIIVIVLSTILMFVTPIIMEFFKKNRKEFLYEQYFKYNISQKLINIFMISFFSFVTLVFVTESIKPYTGIKTNENVNIFLEQEKITIHYPW